MEIADPEARLDRFWGKVDRRHVELIRPWIKGPRALDLGCGYGSFTAAVSNGSLDCLGVDAGATEIAIARQRYPEASFVQADAADLPLDTGSIDTVILRDALHHLVNEGDWDRIAAEMGRVSAPGARLIVSDPNVHALLRLARRVSRHKDEECTFERALTITRELGYVPLHTGFHTYFTLPLSGGYVGPELLPDWARLHAALLQMEERLDDAFARRRVARQAAWRYLIVAERTG